MDEQTIGKAEVVSWLDAAHKSIAEIEAAEREAEEARRIKRMSAKLDAMAKAKAEFETALTAILGEEAAAPLKERIEFGKEDIPFVTSGGYEFQHCTPRKPSVNNAPFRSSNGEIEYRMYIRRPIPDRLREATGWKWYFTDGNTVGSMAGITSAVRAIEEQLKDAEERFAELELQREKERRQAELDLEPPMDEPRAEPVQPVLTHQQRLDVRWLKRIASDIENGLGLSPIDEYILATVHFMQFIDDSD